MMKKVVLIFLIFIVSGCASQVSKLVGTLNTETACCNSYAELEYEKLTYDKEYKFSVGPGDLVFNFPSGKSYFKAFELPSTNESYSIEVRTYLIGEWIPSAHVFGPYFAFLDANHQLYKEEIFPELFWDEGFFEGSRWTGVVQLPPNVKYVVIYTKPNLINKRIALGSTSGYGYSTGTSYVYVPPSGARSSSFGPAGNLRIKFLKNVILNK